MNKEATTEQKELTMGVTKDCTESIFDFHCRPEFERINRTLEKIDKSLNGNGKPGLNTRIDRVERLASECELRRKTQDSRFWEIIRPILIAVIAAVLSAAGVMKFNVPDISKQEIAQIIKQLSENK